MATDNAANSDSTLINSHCLSAPERTISPSASTIWVCGVIGYAQMTSGRQRATASATAREPSICLSINRLAFPASPHALVSLLRRSGVGVTDLGGELFTNRGEDGFDLQHSRDRDESSQ